MKITIDSILHIEDAPEGLLKQLKAELTIRNPDFDKKRRMGLNRWAWGQEYIKLWKEVDMTYANDIAPEYGKIEYILPRGYYARLWELTGGCCIQDNRLLLPQVDYPKRPELRDYQKPALKLARDWQQGVAVAPCGSGKTVTGDGIIADIGQPTLWITHTMDLLKQSMDSAVKFLGLSGDQIGIIQGANMSIGSHVTFATVQTLSKRDLSAIKNKFGCIIVDECFVAGTEIDRIPIEKIKIGHRINTYNHATEKIEQYKVIAILKRRPTELLEIKFSNNTILICTKNHPFWIEEKKEYIQAYEMEAGQHVRSYNLYNMQKPDNTEVNVSSKTLFKEKRESILFSKMRKRCSRFKFKGLWSNFKIQQNLCFGANEKKQSDEKSKHKKESQRIIESYGTQAFKENGKRNRINNTTRADDESTGKHESNTGMCHPHKYFKGKWISNVLQSGFRTFTISDSNRIRRKQPLRLEKKRGRRDKGCAFEIIRVDGITVLEQTSDGTFGGLCPDGYVYNLEVKGNHNYFANSILVHNCHLVIKDADKARMFESVISQFPAYYRFGLTASEHRADGLIETMFAVMGPKFYEVAQDDSRLSVMTPRVEFVETDFTYEQPVDEDGEKGMLSVQQMYKAMREEGSRNFVVARILKHNIKPDNYCLVLGDSLEHLGMMFSAMRKNGVAAEFINGETPKRVREHIMNGMRGGKYQFLFATYALAKLGLDIPRLNRLVLATPHRDKTSIQQAVGRIMRPFEGKQQPIVYDIYDSKVPTLVNWARERARVYKRLGCLVEGGPVVRKW